MSDLGEPTFGDVTFEEFKQRASDFFKYAIDSTEEQIESGFKALSISYFGLINITKFEEHEAILILEMAGEKLSNPSIKNETINYISYN